MSSGPLSFSIYNEGYMYNYRSKCRWNMLLHIDGEVIEIRPGELFKAKQQVDSRYLDLIITKKKPGPKPKVSKAATKTTFEDELNGSSTES